MTAMPDSTNAHCHDLLPWYAAGMLSPAERETVAHHLTTCTSCQRELTQWQGIGATTQRTLQQVNPAENDAASWRQLQSALSSEQPLNGKHAIIRGDRYMEFGNQSSQTIVTAQRNSARRLIVALPAVALVIIVGIAAFALFAPHTPPTSQLQPLGANGGTTTTTTNRSIPPIYLTPGTLVTPAPLPTGTTAPISGIQTSISATNVGGTLKIPSQTALFLTGDTVNVSFKVQGAKANDVISIKWFINNTDITPSLKQTKADCCAKTMADDEANDVIFALLVPSSGFGRGEIYYNSTLAYTVVFDVVTQAQLNTPTPASH